MIPQCYVFLCLLVYGLRSTVERQIAVLQIRRGITDNLGFLHKNIFCDPSLEPSRREGFNEGSQHMFSLRNKKKNIFELSSIPPLIWSSDVAV